jgi:hypothetical protein
MHIKIPFKKYYYYAVEALAGRVVRCHDGIGVGCWPRKSPLIWCLSLTPAHGILFSICITVGVLIIKREWVRIQLLGSCYIFVSAPWKDSHVTCRSFFCVRWFDARWNCSYCWYWWNAGQCNLNIVFMSFYNTFYQFLMNDRYSRFSNNIKLTICIKPKYFQLF